VTGDPATKTTVVIPVWDRYVGAPLDGALASVTEQGVPVTIVVVDNASVVALPAAVPGEIVRTGTRLTLGAARNAGLARVSTPYVLFWDADDLMLPGTLAYLEAAADADPGLAGFGAAIIESPGGARHRWPRRWLARLVRHPRALALCACVWSQFPTTGATLMRTDLVRDCGGYPDADSGDDWCLGVSLAFRGRIGWSERPGRLYRIDPESVWARHMTVRHQFLHARLVRERLRTDHGVPRWVRAALPAIALAQLAALGAHIVVDAVRGRGRPWGAAARSAA
jgi:glycosyltransferase involved in cell wall biosynthesis